jgi:hypothetical protein
MMSGNGVCCRVCIGCSSLGGANKSDKCSGGKPTRVQRAAWLQAATCPGWRTTQETGCHHGSEELRQPDGNGEGARQHSPSRSRWLSRGALPISARSGFCRRMPQLHQGCRLPQQALAKTGTSPSRASLRFPIALRHWGGEESVPHPGGAPRHCPRIRCAHATWRRRRRFRFLALQAVTDSTPTRTPAGLVVCPVVRRMSPAELGSEPQCSNGNTTLTQFRTEYYRSDPHSHTGR